jgi:hypothetical protein
MTALDIPDPNTTVAKLHISRDQAGKQEIQDFLESYLKAHSDAPSGATVIEGTGLWFPEDEELEDEIEENLIIEIWIDNKSELDHMYDLKEDLEDEFDQHCVCLSLENRHYEH